jgi:hypothetical protein
VQPERAVRVPDLGIGRAVPVIPAPIGTLHAEAAELSRLAGGDQIGATVIHVVSRLVVCIPVMRLIDLFDRWATRLELLSKSREGALLRVVHRISRGDHRELYLCWKERIG